MNPHSQLLYESLAILLAKVHQDPRLTAEIARAQREFFQAEGPGGPPDSPGAAVAMTRFAEWYLLERESEVLGATPVNALHLAEPGETSALAHSKVGVFLVESTGATECRIRDMQTDTILELDVDRELDAQAGDLLVGRLYPSATGNLAASPVMARQRHGREVAKAFQRDYRALQLERRLSQAELEHLLFRAGREPADAATEPPVPIERLEAELETLLVEADAGVGATDIAQQLKRARTPGPVLGPLLDRLAFESTVDLEAMRQVLMRIWNHYHPPSGAHHRAPTGGSAPLYGSGASVADLADPADPDDSTDATQTTGPETSSRSRSASRTRPRSFQQRPGETLGESLARRIEEGLKNDEDMDHMFEQVEALLGEKLEDGQEEDAATPYDGDLEGLIHEYLWEAGEDPATAAVLADLVTQQKGAPVPVLHLEYLEDDDLLRFLLRIYLDAPPRQRSTRVAQAYAVLRSFYLWAESTQGYALSHVLEACEERFVHELERLHDASLALSTREDAHGPRPDLHRVVALTPDSVDLVALDSGERLLIPVGRASLRPGDLLLAPLARGEEGRATVDGMAIVLSGLVEPLLG